MLDIILLAKSLEVALTVISPEILVVDNLKWTRTVPDTPSEAAKIASLVVGIDSIWLIKVGMFPCTSCSDFKRHGILCFTSLESEP